MIFIADKEKQESNLPTTSKVARGLAALVIFIN